MPAAKENQVIVQFTVIGPTGTATIAKVRMDASIKPELIAYEAGKAVGRAVKRVLPEVVKIGALSNKEAVDPAPATA